VSSADTPSSSDSRNTDTSSAAELSAESPQDSQTVDADRGDGREGCLAAGLARLFDVALALGYPFIVYWGLTHWSMWQLALAIVGMLAFGVVTKVSRQGLRRLWPTLRLPAGVAVLVGVAAWLDDPRLVLAMPVVISLALLVAFGRSLVHELAWAGRPVPMVERFARLVEPDLSEAKVPYCRAWTWVWCSFFLVNAAAAGALALWAPLGWWTLYTGVVAYVLIGLLFAVERVMRIRRFGGD